ncbi:hypothetical protein SDC9_179667 [bioreactor metagenome]|uniref:Uncharacterized protein n=1 Tax=bioreactor metagenome TaxID=1076179 RepID=A0A645GZF1_9ZZZZ
MLGRGRQAARIQGRGETDHVHLGLPERLRAELVGQIDQHLADRARLGRRHLARQPRRPHQRERRQVTTLMQQGPHLPSRHPPGVGQPTHHRQTGRRDISTGGLGLTDQHRRQHAQPVRGLDRRRCQIHPLPIGGESTVTRTTVTTRTTVLGQTVKQPQDPGEHLAGPGTPLPFHVPDTRGGL